MKRLAVAISLLSCTFGLAAQSISGSPFIAVHGKARTEAVPDIFPLEVTLKDTSQDAAKTQAMIETYARQVVDLTQSMKMDDKDVTISNLSVSPEYRYDDEDDEQVFLGNTYEREIRLRFHSLADLKRMIEALPQAKQLQLDTGDFQSSNADDLRRELLEEAVEDARNTAEVMAKAAGKRLGPVHNISNQGFNVRYADSFAATELDRVEVTGSRVASVPPVVMSEGTISLEQNVYITYTLVD